MLTVYLRLLAADGAPALRSPKRASKDLRLCIAGFRRHHSSIGALRRVQLGRDHQADIVLGLDTSISGEGPCHGLFAPPEAVGVSSLRALDRAEFTPVDFGYFAFV